MSPPPICLRHAKQNSNSRQHVICGSIRKILKIYQSTKKCPPGRAFWPAEDSTCKGCGKKGHWQPWCHISQKTSGSLDKKDQHKYHCGPGGKRHTNPLDVANDSDPHYDEVNVTKWLASHITASQLHPVSTPKLWVTSNAHSTVVQPASTVAPHDLSLFILQTST